MIFDKRVQSSAIPYDKGLKKKSVYTHLSVCFHKNSPKSIRKKDKKCC